MANNSQIKIQILGDSKGASQAFAGLNRSVDQSGSKVSGFGGKFGGALKGIAGMAGGLGVALAGVGIGSFFADAISEARDSQKVGAQTDAVLKSTGNQAHTTAAAIGDLATTISNKTGVDDEAIQSGTNLLLTFTNIRNEAGKGNNILDRTTQVATDMTAAMNGGKVTQEGMKTSSIQLGKALNDPIKGVSALSKVGVSFTAQQKEQIKTLVASGDTLGAQKMILSEVNKEFGGSAAATADPMQKLGVIVGNLKEQVGTALLPYVEKLATWLGANLPGAVNTMMPIMGQVAGVIGVVARAIGVGISWVKQLWASFSGGGGPAQANSAFGTIKNVIVGTVIPAIRSFATIVKTQIWPAIQQMWTQVQPVLTQLRATFTAVFGAVRAIVSFAVGFIQSVWSKFGKNLLNNAKSAFSGIMTVIRGALQVIQGVANVFIGIFTGNWSKAWNGIKQIFSGIWNIIKGLVKTGFAVIKNSFQLGMAILSTLWNRVWNAMKAFVGSIWSGIKSVVSGALSSVKSSVSSGINAAKSVWTAGWNAMKSGVTSAWSGISGFISGIPGKIRGYFSGASTMLSGIGRNIVDGLVGGIRGAASRVYDAAMSLVDKIPGPIRAAMGIHSPSRVMIQIGDFIGQGLAVGMKGTSAKVASTAKTLASNVYKAFADKQSTKDSALIAKYQKEVKRLTPLARKHKSLVDNLARAQKRLNGARGAVKGHQNAAAARAQKVNRGFGARENQLMNLAKKREAVAARLKAAQAKLTQAIAVRNDYAAKVKESAQSFASITNIQSIDPNRGPAAGEIVQGLKNKLAAVTAFNKKIWALKQKGINRTTLDQIIQSGVEGGTQYADSLLAGGGSAIKQVNSIQSQINSAAGKLGTTAANSMYDAGIQSAAGLVKGLSKQSAALAKSATTLAANLVKAVKKALGIHSPSRVFAGIGGHVGQGLINGIDGMAKPVAKSANNLAGVAAGGASAGLAAASYGSGGVGGAGVQVYVTVEGNVTSEKNLADAISLRVRDNIARDNKRNGR